MKQVMELIILFIVSYLIVAFVMASFNFLEWGIIPRCVLIVIPMGLIILNKKFDV